ncbi:uncharacterized protein LOC115314916 [Ixodes scapularis]|uniref:uncharacterized protein LOC115322945 n=1 Tax=Ixodes scapularis TaxID=6945 RepID=UPI001A9DBF34|nr:uncharacterized protein LOC115322945 [Ixodes scapularis]XP_040074760.1 uncharacterized protein LOC115314916 [Ixodes scapularis]
MPRYCAAQDCSNSVCYSGRPAHKFPSEPTLRKLWIRAARPSQPTWKPAKGDCLCTEHFEDEDYKTSPKLLQSLGLPVKQAYLKPDVVPSLFTRKRKRERHSGAVEKRRRKEIIAELLEAPAQAKATLIAEEVSTSSTPSGDDTEQGPDSGHEPMHDANAGIEEPCSSSAPSISNAKQAQPDLRNAATQTSGIYRNRGIQVTLKTSSRKSQTNPVLVTPRCSSPNHVPQAPLDWMLPEGLTLSPQPPVRRQPAPPPDPPQLPTINNELPSAGQEESVEECPTELPEPHVEADSLYLPSDASFLMMMSDTGFLRDAQQNTASDSAPSQHESSKSIDYVSERKFIVFESCLDELLGNCPECTALCRITEKKIRGTCLRVHRMCNNGHQHTWTSQPSVNRRALGDVLLAAATLFSGSIVKKVLRLLHQMGVPCLSYETYFKIQGAFLLPAIRQVWNRKQNELFEQASGRELVLAGDGRSDSPGHSAKYGTYTVVDVSTKKVLHVETVQSNETKGSWAMELEGLKRTLLICEANGLTVGGIITDRHSMIKSFLAKWYPQIRHMFDCWHVAKGIKKRMVSAGKLKSLVGLQDWVQATVKHLYWCAESSDGAPEEILPKWTSLVGHVADLHEHADPLYPRCQHGDLGKKKWLPEGLQAHDKLKSIVLSKPLLKDIPQLSTSAQTYATECFHSTVNQFAPKSTHFGYESMQARVFVAALHFNENSDRPQATTKEGKKRFLVKRPKQTKRPIASPMKGPCTYAYVQELMKETLALNCHYPSYRAARKANCVEAPPTLSSGYERPNKDLLISNHRSRFNC